MNSGQTSWFLVITVILIALATLAPLPPWPGDNRIVVIARTGISWTDAVQNILLFIPFGAALGLRCVSLRQTVLLGACFSFAVEAAQFWIPGRSSALQDLVTNTLGAILGNAVALSPLADPLRSAIQGVDRIFTHCIYPNPRLSRYLALAAGLVPIVIFLLTATLLSPSLPTTTYLVTTNLLDTTPGPLRLGGTEEPGSHFQGKIDDVRIYNRALAVDEIKSDMGTAIESTAPAIGLVAAYSFSEGKGDETLDSSANANNGQIAGAEWVGSGRFGKALLFDGVDDVVMIPSATSLDLRREMTLEAWVYPASAQVFWPGVIQKKHDAYFLYAGSHAGPRIANGGGTFGGLNTGIDVLEPIPANRWSHLTVTYDGTALRLFVDGKVVASVGLWSGNQVHHASIGGVELVPGAFGRSEKLRELLLTGARLKVQVQRDSNKNQNGALLRFVAAKQEERQGDFLFLGIDGHDFIFRLRSLAASWGLPSPPIRARGAVPQASSSDQLNISIRKNGGDYCIQIRDTATCGLGFTIASGWKLFLYSQYFPPWLRLAFDIMWLAALAFPLGFLARRNWTYGAACLVFGLGVLLVPENTALMAMSVHELIALIGGLAAGINCRVLLPPAH